MPKRGRLRMQVGAGVLAALALAGSTASSAGATPPEMTVAEQIALGRALAHRNCGQCHAVGRTGASPNPQAPPFRRMHERFDPDALGEGLATGILTGHPAMPEFRFEPYEVVALIRYLRSVQDRPHVEATTGRRTAS